MHYEGNCIRRPPEAFSILLQVTLGCSHNKCTFCGTYKDKRFAIKDDRVILGDILFAARHMKNQDRVFLMDGDALIIPQDRLVWILDRIHEHLPWVKGIGSYANTKSISLGVRGRAPHGSGRVRVRRTRPPAGVWLFLDGRSWQLRAGSLLAAGWAAHAASVEPRRPRPMRGRPVLWNMLVRCVALYLFAQVFLWWPLWDIERAAWVVFAVLFVVNTVLNIAGHPGDKLPIEHA